MKKILILLIIVLIGILSTYILHDDNQVEELSEEVIEQYTTIDIDLSPSSPEKNIINEEISFKQEKATNENISKGN